MSGRAPARIVALGAGRMGRGIAHAFAYAGYSVTLIDLKKRAVDDLERLKAEALAEIDATLASLAALGVFEDRHRAEIRARVSVCGRDDAPVVLRDASVVFEGVPETIDMKAEAFAFACEHLAADAIVSSTTSTILVTTLADFVPNPERFLNGHWLNPAYLVPLVEVSPHAGTAPAVIERFTQLLQGIGKKTVLCKPAPGFIVPRMQSLIMNEAARMVQEGLATPEDVDTAVRYGLGFRYANMGVVEFIDYGGVDILHYAGNYLADTLDERFRPPAIVAEHMANGRKGLREGRGFYDWSNVDVPEYKRATLAKLVGMLRHQGLLPPRSVAASAATPTTTKPSTLSRE